MRRESGFGGGSQGEWVEGTGAEGGGEGAFGGLAGAEEGLIVAEDGPVGVLWGRGGEMGVEGAEGAGDGEGDGARDRYLGASAASAGHVRAVCG